MVTRAPSVLALVVSVAAAVAAVVWTAEPFGSGDISRAGFNSVIERETGAAIALTTAAAGTLLAAVARWTTPLRLAVVSGSLATLPVSDKEGVS